MRGSGSHSTKQKPLPIRQPSVRQPQRKYYIMRRAFFQGLYDFRKEVRFMCHENALEDLYYGNLNPSAKCFDRDSEYGKFLKIIDDNEQKLTAFLDRVCKDSEESHLFSQLMNAQIEASRSARPFYRGLPARRKAYAGHVPYSPKKRVTGYGLIKFQG